MATWLSSDREKIRKFLCYPLSQPSLDQIQARMDAIAGLSPDAIGTLQGYLKELQDIDSTINNKRDYAGTASYSTAGSSTDYYAGGALPTLRDEGRRFVSQLAEEMGLMIYRDYFMGFQGRSGRVMRG